MRNVGVFLRLAVRCQEIVVALAEVDEIPACDVRVRDGGVAKVAKRAYLPVPRAGVFLAKPCEVFAGFRLQALDLGDEPLFVFVGELRLAGGELL